MDERQQAGVIMYNSKFLTDEAQIKLYQASEIEPTIQNWAFQLFRVADFICVGENAFATAVTKFNPHGLNRYEFFSINPLSPTDKTDKGGEGRRADLNVSNFRTFLFEVDCLPLDEQLDIFTNCGIKFTSITYSGGKSVHALLTINDLNLEPHNLDSIALYKSVWQQLASHIEKSAGKEGIIDAACKNCSRLSRVPNSLRRDTGKRQSLIQLNKSTFISEVGVDLKLIPTKTVKSFTFTSECEIKSVEQLIKKMPTHLRLSFMVPVWCKGDSGNYHHLYRLTLWMLDEVGQVPYDMYIDFLSTNVFKRFMRVGYPQEKWTKAPEDAYTFKGL